MRKYKYKYNIGDLLVFKNLPTIFNPSIGYIIGVEEGQYIVKWLIKPNKHVGKGYYLPEQLKNYIHYPVKE